MDSAVVRLSQIVIDEANSNRVSDCNNNIVGIVSEREKEYTGVRITIVVLVTRRRVVLNHVIRS